MKRILSIFLAVILLISVVALSVSAYNPEDKQIIVTGITRGSANKHDEVLNYLNMYKTTKSFKLEGAEVLKHIYLDDPVCCQVLEEVTKDENGVIQGKSVRTFDKKGNTLTEILYKDNEGKLELYQKNEIEYNENGKPVVGRVYLYKNGEWQINSITRFSFDGNTETDIVSGISGGEEALREKTVLVTDDKGNIIDQKDYEYNKNDWELVSSKSVKFVGKQEIEELFDYENGEIVYGRKFVIEESPYGGDYALWETYDYDTEKKEFVLEEKNQVEYDENGNRKSERTYDGEGILIEARDYEYTLDKNGNEILAIFYDALKGKVPVYRFETEYDENGNDVLEKVYDYDSENDKWIKTSDFISEYDKSGEKIKTTFIMVFDDGKYVVETTYKNNLSHLALKKVNGKAATKDADGWKDYYYCENCKRYYSDAEGKTIIYDIEKWKTGEGKLTYKKSPLTADTGDYAVLVMIMAVSAIGFAATRKKEF